MYPTFRCPASCRGSLQGEQPRRHRAAQSRCAAEHPTNCRLRWIRWNHWRFEREWLPWLWVKTGPNKWVPLIASWSMDVYSQQKKMVMSCHRFWPIPIWNSLKFYILVEFNISRNHEVNLTWTQHLGSSKISSPWWKFQVEFDRFKKNGGWMNHDEPHWAHWPMGKIWKNSWLLCW